MWVNPQETADMVIFTEKILNGKLHFLCSENKLSPYSKSEQELQMPMSKLFHSIIIDKKTKIIILKEPILKRNNRNDIVLISSCLLHYVARGNKVKNNVEFLILKFNDLGFLNHLQLWSDSISSFWWFVSVEVPFIANCNS